MPSKPPRRVGPVDLDDDAVALLFRRNLDLVNEGLLHRTPLDLHLDFVLVPGVHLDGAVEGVELHIGNAGDLERLGLAGDDAFGVEVDLAGGEGQRGDEDEGLGASAGEWSNVHQASGQVIQRGT